MEAEEDIIMIKSNICTRIRKVSCLNWKQVMLWEDNLLSFHFLRFLMFLTLAHESLRSTCQQLQCWHTMRIIPISITNLQADRFFFELCKLCTSSPIGNNYDRKMIGIYVLTPSVLLLHALLCFTMSQCENTLSGKGSAKEPMPNMYLCNDCYISSFTAHSSADLHELYRNCHDILYSMTRRRTSISFSHFHTFSPQTYIVHLYNGTRHTFYYALNHSTPYLF